MKIEHRESGTASRLGVVVAWHLHQPQYRDQISTQHLRPWAYLHGLKDYADMAAHLESVPGARAVVNFSPILLEQLDDYCGNLARHLRDGRPIRDPLLACLAPGGLPTDGRARTELLHACLRANRENQVNRFPAFRHLAERLLAQSQAAATPALDDVSLMDLVMWYHLAWLGESIRLAEPRVQSLMQKAAGFDAADCRQMLELISDVLAGLLPRFRRLAASGRVELSVSPWGHPLLPLMLDFASAQQSVPGLALPETSRYPGGQDRARWHLARAVQVFSRSFGLRPRGCWPADGAISEDTLGLLEGFGFDWVASSERVLQRSQPGEASKLCAYRHAGQQLTCFFRDDELSDRIGLADGRVKGAALASEVVDRLADLAVRTPGRERLAVTLVMDGQNAWEFFPDNGHEFLQSLYQQLAQHPLLEMTTFSRCLQQDIELRPLAAVVPGSWIGGDLSTWVGSQGHNQAWQQLCEAKQLFDQVMVEGGLDEAGQAAAEEALGVCEGSDWYWSLEDAAAAGSVSSFSRLFRRHLGNLYSVLQEAPPASLAAGD